MDMNRIRRLDEWSARPREPQRASGAFTLIELVVVIAVISVPKPGGTLAAWVYGSSQIDGNGMDAIVQDYYALRAAGLSAVGCVGSVLAAPCGDAQTSPPCPRPKSLAAALLIVFRQALRSADAIKSRAGRGCGGVGK
jgi:prepilin-type N-terminal cleavage/methylation domain-containing protein